jgi:pSer/pThr/pTyr-binding forkhead associated (FHA) protein
MAKLTISRDGTIVDNRFIDKPSFTIGSDADSDLPLTGAGISRCHARITSVANDDILEDLASTNGTLVNGLAITQQVLKNNDVIEIADYQIRYRNQRAVDGPSFDKTMIIQPLELETGNSTLSDANTLSRKKQRLTRSHARPALLRDLRSPQSNTTVELTQLLRTVGSANKELAVINNRPHGYFITHVSGRKSTRVNGQAIGTEPRQLMHNDVIEVANEKLQFVQEPLARTGAAA